MTNTTKYEKTEFLAYAVCQISSTTNEDRFYATLNHGLHGVENLSSFGVFDGHLGGEASEALSSERGLHAKVAKVYRNFIKPAGSHHGAYKLRKSFERSESPRNINANNITPTSVADLNEPKLSPNLQRGFNGEDSMPPLSLSPTDDGTDLEIKSTIVKTSTNFGLIEKDLDLSKEGQEFSSLKTKCSSLPVTALILSEVPLHSDSCVPMKNCIEDEMSSLAVSVKNSLTGYSPTDSDVSSLEVLDALAETTRENGNCKEPGSVTTQQSDIPIKLPPPLALDLQSSTGSQSLPPFVKRDALMCEAIRQGAVKIDEEIKSSVGSGSTAISLFLHWGDAFSSGHHEYHAGESRGVVTASSSVAAGSASVPVRAYCANVGDSRCIMLRCNTSPIGDAFGSCSSHPVRKETSNVRSSPLKLTNSISAESSSNINNSCHSQQTKATQSTARSSNAFQEGSGCSVPGSALVDVNTAPVFLPEPTRAGASGRRFVVAHMMSEDHKLALARERLRIISRSPNFWRALPADSSVPYLPRRLRPAGDSTKVPSMKEIQTASLHSEVARMRVADGSMRSVHEGLSAVSCHSVGPIQLNTSGSIFDWNYPNEILEAAAAMFVEQTKAAVDVTFVNQNTRLGLPHRYRTNAPDREKVYASVGATQRSDIIDLRAPISSPRGGQSDLDRTVRGPDGFDTAADTAALVRKGTDPPLINQESFIKQRTAKASNGTIHTGPEALYGRYNFSIMMTRSMGDRYGPRSCIAVPEVSACSIPPKTHARFVLATDGLWDVVAIEDIRCIGLNMKYRDPRVLASHLANKAVRRRHRLNMRMDDITVIVVDVNPNSFVNVEGKKGGEGDFSSQEGCCIT